MDWLLHLAVFSAGIGTGVLLHYFGWSKTSEIKKLMRDYHQLNREHRELQTSIDDYFGTTNHLIKELNGSYDALQNHFNSSVETLGKRAKLQRESSNPTDNHRDTTELPTAAIEHAPGNTHLNQSDIDPSAQSTTFFTPPKAYAPKEQSETGTLSENFGLKGGQP